MRSAQYVHHRHAWLDLKIKLAMAEPLLARGCEQFELARRPAEVRQAVEAYFAQPDETVTPPLTEVVLATLLEGAGLPFESLSLERAVHRSRPCRASADGNELRLPVHDLSARPQRTGSRRAARQTAAQSRRRRRRAGRRPREQWQGWRALIWSRWAMAKCSWPPLPAGSPATAGNSTRRRAAGSKHARIRPSCTAASRPAAAWTISSCRTGSWRNASTAGASA